MAFEGLTSKFNNIFSKLRSRGKLTEQDIDAAMREVRLALLEADVNYRVAKDFSENIKQRCIGEQVMQSLTPAQQVIKIVNEALTDLMGMGAREIKLNSSKPTVILMCGLQGSGKTTHAAKLAKMYKTKGYRPLLVACDIYRPAAIEQLKLVGEAAESTVFEMGQEDPVKIVKAAYSHARDYGNNIVIIDTAGRLHIDEQLMDELKNIKNTIEVDETLLVVDAMTGQDAVNVAENFSKDIGIDGVIITKLDGDSRGGAALSILAVTGTPIKYAGIGEKIDDLEVFHPERMASRILGMGDVLTLIEKAEQEFDEKQAIEMMGKIKKGFDMDDLLTQLAQLKRMGNMKQILAMMPGGANIPDEALDEKAFKRTEAIIQSMTTKERQRPDIINASRKRRIASGSGTKVEDVNRLLKQFEQMNKMMKMMSRPGKRKSRMPGIPGMPLSF
ncbi:MAG: signal recognition particle protein [Oscillospiraceae bacterium]|nr:signal recognition particle protein [Oscillospiraceae bacterium]